MLISTISGDHPIEKAKTSILEKSTTAEKILGGGGGVFGITPQLLRKKAAHSRERPKTTDPYIPKLDWWGEEKVWSSQSLDSPKGYLFG